MTTAMDATERHRQTLPLHLAVEDLSHVGEARRMTASLCRDLGFGETRTGQAALIVTELATNLVKHTAGAGGELVLRPIEEAGAVGIDILSLDRGPGIASIAESLRDGRSTTGSAGTGLGAVRRLSSVFDIWSSPGRGAAVFSRLWMALPPAAPPALTVGAVCTPVRGEKECGDAWAMKVGPDSMLFLLADGLGHGPDAAAAADRAVYIFERQASHGPAELVHLIHAGLRGTRGAAVVVAEVSPGTNLVRYAGVGNITGLILSGRTSRSLVSHNGTAGIEARKVEQYAYPWPEDGLLVLHSDGVATHSLLVDHPGLALKHPALIAGVLFRDHQRPRDDSAVVVAGAADRSAAP
jgi:anti-sigma regulatory factor (Ser/Thr protein kinase)